MQNAINKKDQCRGRHEAKAVTRHTRKAKATQDSILADARSFFTSHPYNKASLRGICEKTDGNHNMIRYHFGSKANLFDTLISQLMEEWEAAIPSIAKEGDPSHPRKGLALFIKRYLDFGFTHPDGMIIIMHNMGSHADSESDKPISNLLKSIIDHTRRALGSAFSIKATEKEVSMWVFGFTMAAVCLIGASKSIMLVSGLGKRDTAYRKWVEAFLNASFYPSFYHLLEGKDSNAFDDINVVPTNKGVFERLMKIVPATISPSPKTKGEITRNRLVQAARSVFSKYPYEVGSIRMIGKEGNIDFTQIRNYFPTKESLFLAVAHELYHEFVREVLRVYDGLDQMTSIMESHNLSTKRLLNHCFKSRQALALIVQNAARIGHMGLSLPGFDYIPEYVTTIERVSRDLETLKAPDKELRFLIFFKALICINSIGAASCYAKLYDMEPESEPYQQWIYSTYIFLIYPRYRDLVLTYGVVTENGPETGGGH